MAFCSFYNAAIARGRRRPSVHPSKAKRSSSGSGRPRTALWISCAATVLNVMPLPPYPSTAKHALGPGNSPDRWQPRFARPEAGGPGELGGGAHLRQEGMELAPYRFDLLGDERVTLLLVGELLIFAAHDDPALPRRSQVEVWVGRLPDQAAARPKAFRLRRRGQGPCREDLVLRGLDQVEWLVTGREHHVPGADLEPFTRGQGHGVPARFDVDHVDRSVEHSTPRARATPQTRDERDGIDLACAAREDGARSIDRGQGPQTWPDR